LNKKYIKIIVLIILEVIINIKGNVKIIIMLSFLGQIPSAINEADYG